MWIQFVAPDEASTDDHSNVQVRGSAQADAAVRRKAPPGMTELQLQPQLVKDDCSRKGDIRHLVLVDCEKAFVEVATQ